MTKAPRFCSRPQQNMDLKLAHGNLTQVQPAQVWTPQAICAKIDLYMRTVIHLSDLRLGAVSERFLDALAQHLNRLQPDLITFSGGLTAQGSSSQLEQAREYLKQLPEPQILVPGKNDRSQWDVRDRLMSRYSAFDAAFREPSSDHYADRELAAIAIRPDRFAAPEIWTELEVYFNSAEPTAARMLICSALPDSFNERESHQHLRRLGVDFLLSAARSEDYLSGSVFGDAPAQVRSGALRIEKSNTPQWALHVLHLNAPQAPVETHVWNESTENFEIRETRKIPHRRYVAAFGSAVA